MKAFLAIKTVSESNEARRIDKRWGRGCFGGSGDWGYCCMMTLFCVVGVFESFWLFGFNGSTFLKWNEIEDNNHDFLLMDLLNMFAALFPNIIHYL